MSIFLIVLGIFTTLVGPFILFQIIENEWVVTICIMVGIAISGYGVIGGIKDDQKECIQNKGSGKFVSEKVIATTQDGCNITEVVVSSCDSSSKTYYVTNCKAITWTERRGKSYVQVTNMSK